jgi:glycosyltransferase involved in cell wall biosynthesis
VAALVPAVAEVRKQLPELRAEIYGDGPEREDVLAAIASAGLENVVCAPGFVERDVLEDAIATALALVLPSRREGYGLVVIESAARGVPVVVVAGPDNAAVELVEDGVNGIVAQSDGAHELAEAIARIEAGGAELRASTAEWFERNAERLSFDRSFARVLEVYGET